MALSDQEKELIQTTFKQIAPQANLAAETFYGRLFEIAPDTKSLFTYVDMEKQGRKLMQTLAMVVGSIHHMETIIPAVAELGKRHLSYGVHRAQYAVVGEALIWTLEQALGDIFTTEARSAWIKVYKMLADAATSVYDEQPLN